MSSKNHHPHPCSWSHPQCNEPSEAKTFLLLLHMLLVPQEDQTSYHVISCKRKSFMCLAGGLPVLTAVPFRGTIINSSRSRSKQPVSSAWGRLGGTSRSGRSRAFCIHQAVCYGSLMSCCFHAYMSFCSTDCSKATLLHNRFKDLSLYVCLSLS